MRLIRLIKRFFDWFFSKDAPMYYEEYKSKILGNKLRSK